MKLWLATMMCLFGACSAPAKTADPPDVARSANAVAKKANVPAFETDCEAKLFQDSEATAKAHDRFAFETEDGLVGFKNSEDHVVIEPRFRFSYGFNEHGLAAGAEARDRGVRMVFFRLDGTVAGEALPFDNGPDYFVNGLARIIENGKVGFIDERGSIVIKPQYDFAGSFCAERAPVCRGCSNGAGGEFGYIDREGTLVVPYQFDSADMFSGEGTSRVRLGEESFSIDRSGARID